MYVADDLGLSQREQVTIIQKALFCILESLTANVGFLHPIGADGRTHRSIDDGNAIFEDLSQRMTLGLIHDLY